MLFRLPESLKLIFFILLYGISQGTKNIEKKQPYSKTLSFKRGPQEEKREKGVEKEQEFTLKRED